MLLFSVAWDFLFKIITGRKPSCMR